MKNALALLVLLLLCVNGWGCGVPAEPRGSRTTFWTDEPKLMPYVEVMAERLARATGRADVRVAPGGIPVFSDEYPESISTEEGQSCASTYSFLDGVTSHIVIDPNPPEGRCMSMPATLVHEGIHALAPNAQHTNEGIFRRRAGNVSRLDETSLAALCGSFECYTFIPE